MRWWLLLVCVGCVDPDQFETAPDAAPDAAQDAAVVADVFVSPDGPELDVAQDAAADVPDTADGLAVADEGADEGADVPADAGPDGAPPPEDCAVRFSVTLPADTPAGDIHVAGTFYEEEAQNWNPGDPALRMERAGEGAELTVAVPNGARLEYKYTRGTWEAGEAAIDCGEVPNRAARVACDNEDPTFGVVDVVVAWRDGCGG